MAEYYRPTIPYFPPETLPNDNRYALISSVGASPTANDFDGDFNYLITGLNQIFVLLQGIAAGILPGSEDENNIDKFPITDGNGNITWSKVTPNYINNGEIPANKIENYSISNLQLGDACVTQRNIYPNSLTGNAFVNSSTHFGIMIKENNVDFQNYFNEQDNDTLEGAKIKNNSMQPDAYPDNSIPATKLVDESITAQQIADNTITADELALVLQLPIGIMMPYAGIGVAAIPGWLFCNGQEVNRVGDYAPLFAVIGTAYGIGDGATTFNLPDSRGRAIVGLDMNNAGAGAATNNLVTVPIANALTVGGNGGFQQITLDVTQIPPHTHTYNTRAASVSANLAAGATWYNVSGGITGSTGGGQPHNNMPPFIFTQYIIYAGV